MSVWAQGFSSWFVVCYFACAEAEYHDGERVSEHRCLAHGCYGAGDGAVLGFLWPHVPW